MKCLLSLCCLVECFILKVPKTTSVIFICLEMRWPGIWTWSGGRSQNVGNAISAFKSMRSWQVFLLPPERNPCSDRNWVLHGTAVCLGVPNFPSNESQSGFSSHLPVGVLLAGWSAGPRTELVVCLLPLWNPSGFLLAKKRQIFMWSDSQELSFLLSGGGTKPAVLRGMNALKSQPAVTAWCDMDVSCGTPCFLSFLFTGRHQQRCGCVYSENIVGCRGTDCGVLKYLQAGGRMVCSPRSHRVRLFRA